MLHSRRAAFRVVRFVLEGVVFSAGILVIAGCGGAFTSTPLSPSVVTLTGNWQLTSSAAAASRLPALSGELTGTTASVTGLFHSNSGNACVAPSSIAVLTGSTNAQGVLTLTGPLAGGSLIVTGTAAADGKSLTNATYAIFGGSCAFASPASATAEAFTPINGTYAGNFTDVYGNVIPVSTQLSQAPAADTSGNFTLNGTATLPANGCFNSPTSTDSTQVTGGSFSVSYTDPSTGNTLTTSGTFSSDGTTLTTGSWSVSGPCSGESGVSGVLTKQ